MATNTLRDLATHYGLKDKALIDHLVKESGILKYAMAFPSTHGTIHKFKKTSALPSASWRTPGGTYSIQSVNDDLAQIQLKEVGMVQEEEASMAEEIGVEQRFANTRPAFLEEMGQSISKGIIYGNNSNYGDSSAPRGWHQIADAHGSNFYTDVGGGDANTTTIFVVRMKSDVSGLVVNNKIASTGQFIRQKWINGGEVQLKSSTSDADAVKPVYRFMYQAHLSWLSATKYSVHALVGVDSSNAPSAAQLNAAIDSVKGRASNTKIFTSRLGRRKIWTLKDSNMYQTGNNFDDRIERWNGIPIILDENINDDDTLSNLPYGLS